MGKGRTTENDYIAFVFNATAMPSYGSNLFVHLHTADPGVTGTSSTNEVAYTGYAAVQVARDGTGWTPSGSGTVTNFANVTFPQCGGGSSTATYASVCSTGGQILYYGSLTAPLNISNLIIPQFPAGTLIMTEA